MIYMFNKVVSSSRLLDEIRDSAIKTALDRITTTSVAVTIYFKAELDAPDILILEAIIEAHVAIDPVDTSKVELTLSQKTAKAIYTEFWQSTCAVDKDGTDQDLSGTDWIEISALRKLWDFHTDYDLQTNNFKAFYNGVYSFDGQFRFTDLLNVTAIEIAIFKRGSPDDYWFIIDRKKVQTLEATLQLSGATMFDFYENEEFVLKVKLEGLLPSCKLSGDDDYTAWGYNLHRPLVNE